MMIGSVRLIRRCPYFEEKKIKISPLGIRSAPWLKYRFVLGPPGWPFVLKLICSSPGRFGYWEGYDPTPICVDSFLICAKIGRLSVGRGRSPGFGSGSGSGWIGALGRGFEFKTSFPGPGRLNLSGNPNCLFVRNFRREPILCRK